jgi:CelD/BcsL family acetyltransferase involved in cellulose biosynthesis
MGVRNIFERPGYRELFTSFAMDPKTRHLVHLSRLEVGTTAAAVSLGFTACACYYLVISSYEGGAIARSGPGRVHLHELLRYALSNDFRCFDFTIGDEPYKEDWSDARLTLYDHLSAATRRGAIAVALINRFRATKRAIKQNPQLWRLFSRTRSFLGAIKARKQNESQKAT